MNKYREWNGEWKTQEMTPASQHDLNRRNLPASLIALYLCARLLTGTRCLSVNGQSTANGNSKQLKLQGRAAVKSHLDKEYYGSKIFGDNVVQSLYVFSHLCTKYKKQLLPCAQDMFCNSIFKYFY